MMAKRTDSPPTTSHSAMALIETLERHLGPRAGPLAREGADSLDSEALAAIIASRPVRGKQGSPVDGSRNRAPAWRASKGRPHTGFSRHKALAKWFCLESGADLGTVLLRGVGYQIPNPFHDRRARTAPFGFSLSPTPSRYIPRHGQPKGRSHIPPVEDHRPSGPIRHDAPCAEHGRARGATMASHLGGATAHSWASYPANPVSDEEAKGVYGSTPVPSAVMR